MRAITLARRHFPRHAAKGPSRIVHDTAERADGLLRPEELVHLNNEVRWRSRGGAEIARILAELT
jgi:hypothetical protein